MKNKAKHQHSLHYAIALFALVLLQTPMAFADDRESAEKYFQAGLSLLKVDNYEDALKQFERSVALYPNNTNLFNLANCYQALQRYAEALAAFDRLKSEFDKELKPEIRAAIDRHEQEIRNRIAWLIIVVEQAGASIRIDGKEVGQSHLGEPRLLGAGQHRIQVALQGYQPIERSIQLDPRARQTESFSLQRIQVEPPQAVDPIPQPQDKARPDPDTSKPESQAIGSATDQPTDSLLDTSISTEQIDQSSGGLVAGWLLTGVGVAGLITGTVLIGLAETRYSGLKDPSSDNPTWNSDKQDDWDSITPFRIGGWSALGAGTTLSVVGILLILNSSSEPERLAQSTEPNLHISNQGVEWRVDF